MRFRRLTLVCIVAWASQAAAGPRDLLKDPAYRRAHEAMLGPHHYLPWIAELDCAAVSHDPETGQVGREDWTELGCCKSDSCTERLVILYSPSRHVAYGSYVAKSGQHYLGNPPQLIKEALDAYLTSVPSRDDTAKGQQWEPDRD